MHLPELCLPGQACALTTVIFPNRYLATAMTHGAFQITLSTGYLLIRRTAEKVHFEFRGVHDLNAVRVEFLFDDFQARLTGIEADSDSYVLAS